MIDSQGRSFVKPFWWDPGSILKICPNNVYENGILGVGFFSRTSQLDSISTVNDKAAEKRYPCTLGFVQQCTIYFKSTELHHRLPILENPTSKS
jgi:hypothetical protein